MTPGLDRHTAEITAGNLVARLTGLVRVVAVAGALGTTFLGNTYQTANLVSNIVFELLAAGLITSVLVPTFVRLFDAGRPDEATEVAGALLGLGLDVLGVVTVAGLARRTWIMRALTIAVDDPAVRAEEVRLGSFLLLLFLPQILLYVVGGVATALLHGSRHFVAPAFAPVANNVVVIATMAVFWAMEGGVAAGAGGLGISDAQRLVLALGTTAGVAAMTLVAVVGAWRAGLRLRPRWDPGHAGLRHLGGAGMWGAAYLALNQALVVTTLVLANRVEGGVVAYQIAFTVFLLPFALGAHPSLTAVYPRLVTEAAARQWRRFADALDAAGATVVFLVAPASALLVALAGPALDVVRLGQLDTAGADLAGRVLGAYALGLLGYAGFHLFTRASYATGDMRSPTLVNAVVTAGGSLLMLALFGLASGDDRVVVLDLGPSGPLSGMAAPLARGVACAVGAGVVARLVADGMGDVSIGGMLAGGRVGAAVTVAVSTVAAVAVYVAGQWWLRAPQLRRRNPAGVGGAG
ncbi:MAG: lipid II flippase MurJ [Acidimicrobiales bacterium]